MSSPIHYIYDGTFEGYLTVVFQAYETRKPPEQITIASAGGYDLFCERVEVMSDPIKAMRVWKGLIKKTTLKNARMVHAAFLSQLPGCEMLIWRYLNKIFTVTTPVFFQNMLDEDVFQLVQTARKVKKEAHRFLGFVRFQQTADGILFAPIAPDHDILTLITGHFKARYAGQQWVIYDTRRNYGVFFDQEQIQEIELENAQMDPQSGKLPTAAKEHAEDYYQKLWQQYYHSVNIAGRSNPRQMTRMMPRRYWRYLPEKDEAWDEGEV
jgi:probable DNA metabolism protein